MRDIYGNVITLCDPNSKFCGAHERESVLAQLWLGESDGSASLAEDSVTSVVAGGGKAVFDDLRVTDSGTGYTLRFLTPEKEFPPNGSPLIIGVVEIMTPIFTVYAGRPVSIAAVKPKLLTADAELFLEQPHIEFREP